MKIPILLLTATIFASRSAHAQNPAREGAWKEVAYGETTTTLTCNPLAACLVQLEAGEVIEARFLADSSGWEVEPGTAGPSARIPVLVIKPHRCGETTNLFVTTDRRVYTLVLDSPSCDPETLKASASNFDQIRFTYAKDFARLWQDGPVAAPSTPNSVTAASRLDQLNFDYTLSAGRSAIEPKVVYDDGHKTFIVLREDDLRKDAPAVFVHGEGDKLETVNFTPPPQGGNTYTVDRVCKQLVLVSGPKTNQRTTITNHRAEH